MLNLNELNTAQRAAVEYNDGPQLVVAGAGSGKTRVLTYKIAFLIEKGMHPWNILALTFTNKAAEEMKERIASQVGEAARSVQMGTFHSIFARILRIESVFIGYRPQFTIYDETDSRSLIKSVIKEMKLDDKVYTVSAIQNRISWAKNHLIKSIAYKNDPDIYAEDKNRKLPLLGQIYDRYQNKCIAANVMDYDDLLINMFYLLKEHNQIREKYEDRFKYILVDEYQDTNYAQQQILLLLRQNNGKICVVGDDYQSIYGFRGANIDNILTFQRVFVDAQVFKLEQNYRSTQRIVSAANSLMKHNLHKIDKNVYSKNEEGSQIRIVKTFSDREEAIVVCNEIEKIKRREHWKNSAFAVLYRTNAQSRQFEEELRKRSLPYKIYGGTSFYQRKEIKDILAYFRLIVNPDDEEAFKRIVNFPKRGIGTTTIDKLLTFSGEKSVSPWRAITTCDISDLGTAAQKKLNQFADTINEIITQKDILDVYNLAKLLFNNVPILAEYKDTSDPDNTSRIENVEEMLNSIEEFVETMRETEQQNHVFVEHYLQEVSLLTGVDSSEMFQNDETDESDKISLMTIHMAKGLEFPSVFIVGMEEQIFPSMRSASILKELEEERRLLYVAITRAERYCYLTYAKSRWQYGEMRNNAPSRFLKEIDKQYLKTEDMNESSGAHQKLIFSAPKQYTSHHYINKEINLQKEDIPTIKASRLVPISSGALSTSASSKVVSYNLAKDDKIEHQRFGIGTVLEISGEGEETKALVEFTHAGTKQLLLKFAKFKKL